MLIKNLRAGIDSIDSVSFPSVALNCSSNVNLCRVTVHGRMDKLVCGGTNNNESRLFTGPTMRYEIAAQIFLATVRAARQHREFSMLDVDEQNRILRRGWAAAFLLRAAIWPIDLSNFRKRDGSTSDDAATAYDALVAARSTISKLRLDRIEISILETLLLCRPGKA